MLNALLKLKGTAPTLFKLKAVRSSALPSLTDSVILSQKANRLVRYDLPSARPG